MVEVNELGIRRDSLLQSRNDFALFFEEFTSVLTPYTEDGNVTSMTDDTTTDDAPQTAMLLTETEWTDLAEIAKRYLEDTSIVDSAVCTMADAALVVPRRRRNLARRIIEAAS